MEHCPYATLLSNGKDFRDCGRPCDTHRIDLRDHLGHSHPLIPDAGCRNTLFDAQPQSAMEYMPRMLALGIRHFRVELLQETGSAIAPLISKYRDILAGRVQPRVALRSLNVLNQLGVSGGTLARD